VSDGFKRGILAVVINLKRRVAVEFLRHFRVPRHRQNADVARKVELTLFVLALRYVNRGVADIQNRRAAAREHTEPIDELRRNQSVGRREIRRGRREHEAVLEIHSANVDGAVQMRVI